MDDAAKPPETPTMQLPKADADEIFRAEMRAGMTEIRSTLKTLADDGVDMKQRMIRLEGWRENVDERLARQSGGVQELRHQTSQHDLSQEAALADALVRQKKLEADAAEAKAEAAAAKEAVAVVLAETKAQTEILSRLDKITKNPIVKAGVSIALTALASYLATRGVHIQ